MTRLLTLLLCALAASSLLNHFTQGRALVHCQEQQARLREKLSQVIRSFAKQEDRKVEQEQENDELRSARVAALLAEVLSRRQGVKKDDFEVKYQECADAYQKLNDTMQISVQDLRLRLSMAERSQESEKQVLQGAGKELTEALGKLERLRNETLAIKHAARKEVDAAKAKERAAVTTAEKLKAEVQKLNKEIGQLRAGANSDASFFSQLDSDDGSVPPVSEEEFTSSVRVTKAAANPRLKPKTGRVDCAKLSFEFNTKRLGTTLDSRSATSANRCKRICLSEDDCQAWTFVSDTSECILKQDIGDSVMASCCISGIRCEAI